MEKTTLEAALRKVDRRLTDAMVRGLKEPGKYPDGDALWLQVTLAVDGETVRKSWVVRVRPPSLTQGGEIVRRPRDLGLGSWPQVSLTDARQAARKAREVAQTADPIEARDKALKDSIIARQEAAAEIARSLTFKQCAEAYVRAHRPSWRSDKHAAQITGHLHNWTYPKIGALPVSAIGTGEVMQVLEQEIEEGGGALWHAKPETASRVRLRIENILDWARVRGYRDGENPARWRGHLDKLLPQPGKVRKPTPFRALPYAALPSFVSTLRTQPGIAARALELTILCATRTNETLGARVGEFDLEAGEWVIPAERMKAGREHKIPLTPRAVAIVRDALAGRKALKPEHFVFIGATPGRPLSNMALLQLLRRMGVDATTHGFRSTLRDWAADKTSFPLEVRQRAIAHVVGSASEQSYERTDQFAKRRQLMVAFAAFIESRPSAKAAEMQATP